MQTVREILQIIRALLVFLLNLKKKKQDGKKNETGMEPISPNENDPTFLTLYLAALGIMALWTDRTEVALACVGALLTRSGYAPSADKARHTPSPPASDGG